MTRLALLLALALILQGCGTVFFACLEQRQPPSFPCEF